ncbi:MAG TPA: DUF6448 family protein [Actinomycetota bacterium]|nr:DUF6448 family protein [Actinomycetota bacterium]
MPPHCDSLDGPVVKAAIRALDEGNVDLVLPFVKEESEGEVRAAFARSTAARTAGPEAREVADLYFFETVVRVHRRGENAPYTGLKPAGLDLGPVIPVAEQAIETGSPDELVGLLSDVIHEEVKRRLEHVLALRPTPGSRVREVREYVEAMLGLQVWSNRIFKTLRGDPHGRVG